jgi:Gpi18-like mannosyltransferase
LSKKYGYLLHITALFLFSRLIIITGFIYGSRYLKLYNKFKYPLLRYDSFFYLSIASAGYKIYNNGKYSTVVFFPLYPLLSKLFSILLFIPIYTSMTIISNIAGFLAAFYFYKFAKLSIDENKNEETANIALILFLTIPVSIYLNAAYARPLLILFAILCFYLLKKKKVYLAGLFSGLATALNPVGITISIGYIFYILKKFYNERKDKGKNEYLDIKNIVKLSIVILLSFSGFVFFILYQWIYFKNPFLFILYQNNRNMLGTGSFVSAIINGLTLKPIFMADRTIFHFRLNEVFFGLFLFVLIVSFYKKIIEPHLLSFMCALISIDYFAHISKLNYYSASSRILYLGFPVFLVSSILIKKSRRKEIYLTFFIILFSIMLFYFSAWFYKGYWID